MRGWFDGLRDRYGVGAFAVGGGIVVASIALVLVAVWPAQAGTVEVHLERADEVGPDPFTDSLSFTDVTVPGRLRTIAFGDGVTIVEGTAPGLYGGTGSDAECDPAQLIAFLVQEPDKAAAWAEVQGIEVGDLPDYIASLTPAVLMNDTWVTNHGYRDGRATPRQAILQAGTAVLVDDQGVPRARCKCGNPLTESQVPSDLGRIEYVGEPWEGFELDEVVRVVAAAVGDGLFLTRLPDGQPIFRPLGTTGADDLLVADDGRFVQELDLEEALPETTPAGSGPFPLPPTTSAGLPVEYEVTGPCRWDDDDEELTLTGVGTCEIVGASPGDDTWSGLEVERSLLVEARAQAIAVPEVGVLVVGEDPVELGALADSGLPLSFEIEGPCEIADGALIGLEPGTCTITITQEGDDGWAPAEPVVIEIEVLDAAEAGEREPQTISFSLPGSMRFGTEGVPLEAIASSGLRVTFSVSGPCRISGSRLVPTATGTCIVTAVQAGDEDHQRAVVTDRITVTAQTQTIDLSSVPPSITVGGAVPLPASSSAGVSVTYSTSGPCSVANRQLTVTGPGTCTLTASAGSTTSTSATSTSVSIEIVEVTVDRQGQTITFPAPPGLVFGGPGVTLTATASSGLPVDYTVTSGPCTESGSMLSATGAGTCTVVASQAGDAEFEPAANVSRSVQVDPGRATVSIDAPGSLLVGESASVAGSSSAGLPVVLSATGGCSLSGSTLTATAEGTCTVTGDQAATTDIAAASASVTVAVSKRPQSISLNGPGTVELLSTAAVEASATSGLPVALTVSGPCRLAGTTLTPTAVGTCTVTGTQAGDGAWASAPAASVDVAVVKATQEIDYGIAGTYELFDAIPMDARASSGLPVTYAVSLPCQIDDPYIYANGLGGCTITVTQAGDDTYAARTITRDVTVVKRSQSIDFPQPSDMTEGGQQRLTATATSRLPVTYSATGDCGTDGDLVVAFGPGSCTVTASQGGDGTWAAAASVSRTFTIFPLV